MRRFFIDSNTIGGDTVCLSAGESRHIVKVLRLSSGDTLELLDGAGRVFSAEIIEIGRNVTARIIEELETDNSDRVKLIVGQGQLKGKKMDLVIQKCTELGVDRIVPFWSSRCQGKLSELQGQKKLERYQRIIESACKQCYRSDLMDIDTPVDFAEILTAFPEQRGRLKLLFWEEEKDFSLHDLVVSDDVGEVVLLLGPEGGLSVSEAEEARSHGWQTVSLGKRILRAETATMTAVSLAQFLVNNI